MKNLKNIITFIEVAETGSFTKTATKLHLTNMAISKQIQNIESSIGEQLFIRTTRKVRLTEFGEAFYLQCKKLYASWQALDSFVHSHKLEPQGKLRVCISRAFGKAILMRKLQLFSSQYKKLDIEVTFSEEPRVNEFQDGMFDILFGFPELPGITDNLKYRKLYQTKNVLCASKDYINRNGTPKHIDELTKHKFINHSFRHPPNIIPLADGQSILTPSPCILMNSFEALTEACCDGCGIFLTGDLLVDKHLKSGRLIKLLPELNYRIFQLYLFYRPMTYENPSIRAFIDFYSSFD